MKPPGPDYVASASVAGDRPHDPDAAQRFMSVREVAEYLQINQKKVYALVTEGKIPATKVTGKWLFPRDLLDNWLLESSHGGVLTDRLILAGSDDPLLRRVVTKLADAFQARALVSYTCTGTQLGLALLSGRRVDACGIHWGPASESHVRHPALVRHFPQAGQWVLVRAFYREQGLMVSPRLRHKDLDISALLRAQLRWVFRQEGAGSQRFLRETAAQVGVDITTLQPSANAYSEQEAAALIAMGQADVAPGTRSAASESGLVFVAAGWEAFDLVLYRGVYFRTLFQTLLDHLRAPATQQMIGMLQGYDCSEAGRLVWSA